jgi:hypothetical protein
LQKQQETNHKQWGTVPKWTCALNQEEKIKRMAKIEKNGFRGKNEKLANGRPAVGRLTRERPVVVLLWWGRCWVVVGVGGFGFREEKDGGGVSGVLYGRRGRMGKEGKK